jgi:hypothetical protein
MDQKTPKMSEQPTETLQDFLTSKLNTRVRFPSPAPKELHLSNVFGACQATRAECEWSVSGFR